MFSSCGNYCIRLVHGKGNKRARQAASVHSVELSWVTGLALHSLSKVDQ